MSNTLEFNESVLAVHVVGDDIWTGRPNQAARRTRMKVAEFADSIELSGEVRLLGTGENAGLLCRLHERYAAATDISIEVCTPQMSVKMAAPANVIRAVAESKRFSPSLGGWHRFSNLDYPSYALADMYRREHVDPELVSQLLQQHPTWPLVGFIPTLNLPMYCRWLACVRDPRWFVSEFDPDRTSRMEQYLGLKPATQLQVRVANSRREKFANASQYRCQLTQRCWLPETVDAVSAVDVADPRNFLFRVLGGRIESDPVKAICRTSQMFTRFVRGVWLNGMSKGTPHAGQLFTPEHFFKNKSELEAFEQFASLARVQ